MNKIENKISDINNIVSELSVMLNDKFAEYQIGNTFGDMPYSEVATITNEEYSFGIGVEDGGFVVRKGKDKTYIYNCEYAICKFISLYLDHLRIDITKNWK